MVLTAGALFSFASITGCAQATTQARVEKPAAVATPREILNGFQCEIEDPDAEGRDERDNARRVAALQLGLDLDHIRFVHSGSGTAEYLIAAKGGACETSTNKVTCEAKLAELDALGHSKDQVFAITTKGDELKLYQDREVVSLLGAIDNVYKAWLVLMVDEDAAPYSCNEPEWDGFRETADGYDLAWVWTGPNCRPFQRRQGIAHVDRDGHVRRLRTHIVEHDAERCIIDERPLKQRQPSSDDLGSDDEGEQGVKRRSVLR